MHRIVQIQEIIPLFGVPETLLSDRGTNLLSHLMKDVCHPLGIDKLNTTAYHPQCNGLTERFNRILQNNDQKARSEVWSTTSHPDTLGQGKCLYVTVHAKKWYKSAKNIFNISSY